MAFPCAELFIPIIFVFTVDWVCSGRGGGAPPWTPSPPPLDPLPPLPPAQASPWGGGVHGLPHFVVETPAQEIVRPLKARQIFCSEIGDAVGT